jgi:hypothetical protein
MTETLDETRARFRREFPVMAAEYDAHMAIANTEQLLYFWHYFAAGAGHPNDVKFKGD